MPKPPNQIASRTFLVREPDKAYEVTIRILQPYCEEDEFQTWCCEVLIEYPYETKCEKTFGVDSMQSLLLGIMRMMSAISVLMHRHGEKITHMGDSDLFCPDLVFKQVNGT